MAMPRVTKFHAPVVQPLQIVNTPRSTPTALSGSPVTSPAVINNDWRRRRAWRRGANDAHVGIDRTPRDSQFIPIGIATCRHGWSPMRPRSSSFARDIRMATALVVMPRTSAISFGVSPSSDEHGGLAVGQRQGPHRRRQPGAAVERDRLALRIVAGRRNVLAQFE